MKKSNLPTLFHEISAGGIIFREKRKRYEIVVINRNDMNDWTLPKGHQKPGESLQDTSLREVYEEAGIRANPAQYLGNFSYSVQGIAKSGYSSTTRRTVHWFLMEHQRSKFRKPDREVKRVRWVSVDDDFSFMTYQNDRRMIQKAIRRNGSIPLHHLEGINYGHVIHNEPSPSPYSYGDGAVGASRWMEYPTDGSAYRI